MRPRRTGSTMAGAGPQMSMIAKTNAVLMLTPSRSYEPLATTGRSSPRTRNTASRTKAPTETLRWPLRSAATLVPINVPDAPKISDR